MNIDRQLRPAGVTM